MPDVPNGELRELQMRVVRLEERATARDAALEKALAAREDHDEQANKVVETLRAVIQDCLRKDEYERRHQDIVAKIDTLRDFRSNVSGREAVLRAIAVMLGILIGMVGLWLKTK